MQSSQIWEEGEELLMITIPQANPFHAMQITSLALRWPRYQCQMSMLALDPELLAISAASGGSSPLVGKELRTVM